MKNTNDMITPLRKLIGLNGVARNEFRIAQRTGKYFEWLMFIIALCLPFYWYVKFQNNISPLHDEMFHWFIWLAFITELVVITFMVRNKKYYIRTNWLNIIIMVFTFPLFWFHMPVMITLRLLRILILFRVLLPWWDRVRDILTKNNLTYTLMAFLAIVIIGGSLISLFDSGIKDPYEGIWWAMQTITTVGYGDVIPVTYAGKIFACLIMIMGIAMITILTANFSAYLLGHREKLAQKQQELLDRLEAIDEHLNKVEDHIKNIEQKLK